jgi:hypothetical protein
VKSEGAESSVADIRRMMINMSMSIKKSVKRIYKNNSMSPKRA